MKGNDQVFSLVRLLLGRAFDSEDDPIERLGTLIRFDLQPLDKCDHRCLQ